MMGSKCGTYVSVCFFVTDRDDVCWGANGVEGLLRWQLGELGIRYDGLYGCRFLTLREEVEVWYEMVVVFEGDRRSLELLLDVWRCFQGLGDGAGILLCDVTRRQDWGFVRMREKVGDPTVEFFGDSVEFEDMVFEDSGYYYGNREELDDSYLSLLSCGDVRRVLAS